MARIRDTRKRTRKHTPKALADRCFSPVGCTRQYGCTSACGFTPSFASVSNQHGVGFDVVQMGAAPKPGWVGVDSLGLQGFERVEHVAKSSYADTSMCVICPSRSPMIHQRVVQAWQSLIWPMNGKRAMFIVSGAEVGKAYDDQVADILAHPELSKWKYILTLEDDNLPPPDAPLRLCESIEAGPFDAVGGLYFTKGEFNMPMAYGDPAEYARTGVLDFRPRDVTPALRQGGILPVNGIAMGCSLYRTSVFRELPRPWFMTLNDIYVDGPKGYTQDLFFCEKAVRAGKRFAVDCRVRVGHLDIESGVVY